MRKRPYVQWERQAREILGPDVDTDLGRKPLVKPLALALHKAFVRGYARAAYRRRPPRPKVSDGTAVAVQVAVGGVA